MLPSNLLPRSRFFPAVFSSMVPLGLAPDQSDDGGGSGCCWEQVDGQLERGEHDVGSGSPTGRESSCRLRDK